MKTSCLLKMFLGVSVLLSPAAAQSSTGAKGNTPIAPAQGCAVITPTGPDKNVREPVPPPDEALDSVCQDLPQTGTNDTPDQNGHEARKQAAMEENDARYVKLEAEMARKDFDPEWSPKAKRLILDAFDRTTAALGADGSAVQIMSVNCAVRLCRIELTNPDQTLLPILVTEFSNRLGWGGEPDIQDSGGSTATLFVVRESEQPKPSQTNLTNPERK